MPSELTAFEMLQSGLQAANLRQQVYSNNIANADTPGYKREDVSFESMLDNALSAPVSAANGQTYIPIGQSDSGNWSLAAQVQPVIVQGAATKVDNNGNNVDINTEMANLAENQIRYNALVADLQQRFGRLRSAINGG